MEDKPRDSEGIIDRKTLKLLIVHAITMMISLAGTYFFVYTFYPVFPENLLGILSTEVALNQQKARTMSMAVLLIIEAFVVLSIRRPNQSLIDSTLHDFFWLFPPPVSFLDPPSDELVFSSS